MKLTYEQVRIMNDVQKRILEAFIDVCTQLNLHYYIVHGSLLGAYTREGFYPFDDDIDLAMPRRDYNALIKYGQKLLPDNYFLQSYETEEEFPLPFAKIRDTNTTFIQPMLRQLHVNMGFYIDVFPIDNYPRNKVQQRYLRLIEAVLSARISKRLKYDYPLPLWRKACQAAATVFCPSWKTAVKKRAELYAHIPSNGQVIMIGGKRCERGIPQKWFSDGQPGSFEGLCVQCPQDTDAYLKHIYGDYETYNPVHEYMNDDQTLTVTASSFDSKKSYKEYL